MGGGVCAVLDYEPEAMAEYIADMATRVVLPQKPATGAFRKFVSQILTSTRLPSTTILLGMNYLAKRAASRTTTAGSNNQTEGQVWRLVTVALLLGSKFLDDNTFQNKSWSEVSGISVQELNTLEYEWLTSIDWHMYVNLDEDLSYKAWLENWQTWSKNKKMQQHVKANPHTQASRERLPVLSPIDTNPLRARKTDSVYSSWHEQQIAEYERLASLKRSSQGQVPSLRREQPWAFPITAWHASPLTPPDSAYGTPEYPRSATSYNANYNEWLDGAVLNGNAQRPYQPSTQYNAFNQGRRVSGYQSLYPHSRNIWESPAPECNCANCFGVYHHKHHHQPYFMAHSCGQPVVG